MIALIDLYQKELLKVNGFSPSTVETYTLSLNAFFCFAKNELQTDPVKVNGPQLLQWILHLKNTGLGYSRIENHHYALKSFFAFVKKTGLIDTNPAEVLPLLITRRRKVTKPIQHKTLLNCSILSIRVHGPVCATTSSSPSFGRWALEPAN